MTVFESRLIHIFLLKNYLMLKQIRNFPYIHGIIRIMYFLIVVFEVCHDEWHFC